jgi:hypothetical protein
MRIILLANLSMLHLFFLLKKARNEKIYQSTHLRVRAKSLNRTPLESSCWNLGAITSVVAQTEEYQLIESRSELPRLDVWLKYLYKFVYYYNWYLLAKHLTLCLLRSKTFAHLRFLDCFLPGRFIVNGRVIDVASTCACYLIVTQLFWIHLVWNMNYELRLPCIEFLLKTREEIINWNQCRLNGRMRPPSGSDRKTLGDEIYNTNYQNRLYSTVFHLRNSLEASKTKRDSRPFSLRPNRTPKAWSRLYGTIWHFNLLVVPFMLALVVIFVRMVTPITLTQSGFELNYRYCITWLRSDRGMRGPPGRDSWLKRLLYTLVEPDKTDSTLSQPIGLSNKSERLITNEIWMPYADLVRFNLYNIVRISLDLFDSTFIYLETAFCLSAMALIATILIEDLIFYASHLNTRLERQIMLLRSERMLDQQERNLIYPNLNVRRTKTETIIEGFDKVTRPIHMRKSKSNQVSEAIQAQAADLFSHLNNYNKYIQYQSLHLVFLWLSYSALVTSWIFLPGNESPKIEWYVVHFFATVYLFIFMARFAVVKRYCTRMYKLISIAMALDDDCGTSKTTWMALAQFYAPVPLHCFTFIAKIQLDLMFGLKLVAWLASALIITASFFTVYNLQ